jgi:hypothetical protein
MGYEWNKRAVYYKAAIEYYSSAETVNKTFNNFFLDNFGFAAMSTTFWERLPELARAIADAKKIYKVGSFEIEYSSIEYGPMPKEEMLELAEAALSKMQNN